MKLTLRQKITFFPIVLLLLLTVAANIISTTELQKYFRNRIFEQLRNQLEEIQYLLTHAPIDFTEPDGYRWLSDYAKTAQFRLTIIRESGEVMFDSQVPQDSLVSVENHRHRPEIEKTLLEPYGRDERLSRTIHESMFYVAKRIEPGRLHNDAWSGVRFLRLAIPLQEVQNILETVRWKISLGGLVSLIVMAMVSYYLSRKLTFPIQKLARVAESVKQGNLEEHFEHRSDDELGELAELLNDMLKKLKDDLIQLRKLETMRSQFLGNVSHELRTPIFAVQGYLETLLHNRGNEPKMQKKFIKKAYRQAVRLNNLLTDLIDISRIESGEMKMTFVQFDVRAWLEKLYSEWQVAANDQGIRLALRGPETPRLIVLGDQDRLTQVINNLVDNAMKYNVPNGSVLIGYRDLGKAVELSVSDAGKGIAEQHIPRIFERFYRVDKERSRSLGGTGLGLAIVKHIVEAHGSQIMVQSQVGLGSRFSFSLQKNST